MEHEHDLIVAQAWHTVNIYVDMKNKGKLLALKDFLVRPVRPQTTRELRHMVESLSEAYKIPLRKGRRGGR